MTAVDFLHSEYKRIFGDVLVKPSQAIETVDALEKAKEMFEQQIIDAYNKNPNYFDSAEQYYNETFKK